MGTGPRTVLLCTILFSLTVGVFCFKISKLKDKQAARKGVPPLELSPSNCLFLLTCPVAGRHSEFRSPQGCRAHFPPRAPTCTATNAKSQQTLHAMYEEFKGAANKPVFLLSHNHQHKPFCDKQRKMVRRKSVVLTRPPGTSHSYPSRSCSRMSWQHCLKILFFLQPLTLSSGVSPPPLLICLPSSLVPGPKSMDTSQEKPRVHLFL